MTNADLIVRMLAEAGVRHAFGVPSGPVLPLIEAMRESGRVEFVLTASETSAGFMAEATGRLTGVPGVCVSTLGPGATNMATGVGGAWLDRSPALAIVCTYGEALLERRTQMRIDHLALFAPITKAQRRVKAGDAAQAVAEAIAVAAAEPPGPVLLELPEDVSLAPAPGGDLPAAAPPPAPSGAPDDLAERLGALLAKARRPIVLTGLTFTRAKRPLRLLDFLRKQRMPYVSTLHAKGFLPESYPGALGVVGRARRTDIKRLLDTTDLVIGVGYDPIEIDVEDWAPDTPLVRLSTESAEEPERSMLALEAVGDLDALLDAIAEIAPAPNAWTPGEWAEHRSAFDANLRPPSLGMAGHHVLDALRDMLPADGILAYDVGAHTHQIASQWSADHPHTAVCTNGWSSMGYGMPAAYAAKLAHPERQVVGVVGDGCFQMTAGELAAARRLRLPVPIVVLNDGWLGLMKIKQERREYGDYGSFLGEPAEAPQHYFGVPVRAVRTEAALREALRWGFALDGPSVIEAFIDVEPYGATVFDEE